MPSPPSADLPHKEPQHTGELAAHRVGLRDPGSWSPQDTHCQVAAAPPGAWGLFWQETPPPMLECSHEP